MSSWVHPESAATEETEGGLSRRTFLNKGAAATVGLGLAGLGSTLTSAAPSAAVATQATDQVTLNEERFQGTIPDWTWSTPGDDQPGSAWSRAAGPTPTSSAGPSGGADPTSRVTTAGNGFAYTEASNDGPVWTIESPTLDATKGPLTLTFDVHMRFGSSGAIADGTLEVQGWTGSAWTPVGPAITGSQQPTATAPYQPSTDFGSYSSDGFTNTDFKFRFRFRRGASRFFANYDCAIDNVTILGPSTGQPPPPPIDDVLDTALRTVFVDAATGDDRNSGLAANQAKRTIQAGIGAAQPGDIVLVKPGTYREIVSVRNKRSSKDLPLWILAERPGSVVLSDLWPDAESGTVNWRNDGRGVFSAPRRSRPYLGTYTDEQGTTRMLFQYNTERDLRARSLRISSVQGTQDHNKPLYGFAAEGGRVHIRLDDSSGAALNPNGRSVKLTGTFGRPLMTVTNTPYLIVDGIRFEGAGNADAVSSDAGSHHLTVRNCVFELCRRCVRVQDDFLAEWNEYSQSGFVAWAKDLLGRNPEGTGSLFALAKSHFSDNGNAFMEGGFAERADSARSAERAELRFNYLHGVFEGHRFGAFNNSVIHHERAEFIGDNWIEFEHFRESSPCRNLSVHDSRCSNSHDAALSHQETGGSSMRGPHFVYRCVVDNDPAQRLFAHPFTIIKNQRMDRSVRAFYYHNYFQNTGGRNAGFGGLNYLYWDSKRSGHNPDQLRFYNNIVDFPEPLSQGGAAAPVVRGNVLRHAGNVAKLTANGGLHVGDELDDLGLDENLVPRPGSPVLGRGRSLDQGLVDSRTGPGANDDVGPFKLGDPIDDDWPRPRRTTFTDELPDRWTSPGSP